MPNRLINETSPYLLQHAHNPVNWYAWSDDALQRARAEDKPIFLSIGYAACHWCHVMEHESFVDATTAQLLNEHFISIKVDREERPDLDSIYMNAVVAMTGQGGWPMSVFLTPDGAPFYGGTYFPNTRRFNMPAFMDVLAAVVDAWRDRRADLIQGSARNVAILASGGLPREWIGESALSADTLAQAGEQIYHAFDWTNGGWGDAPKFPQPMTLEFLMRRFTRTRDELTLKMITTALTKMARGGIYDQLGGGFHRYSTNAIWLVPHFEKMLYDNALLARVYLHAYQITRDEFYRRIVIETLDYVAREMTHARGGFFSTQDADSEGVEGKFYVWSAGEIRAALGDDAKIFADAYGVTEQGNFEEGTILFAARDFDVVAGMNQLSREQVETRLAAARNKLLAARAQRVKPARDEKILTAWNGLMLAAFAEAARVLHRDDYRAIAERNADFVLAELRGSDGRLLRSWKDGAARLNGYLEDYANFAEGLLALYETTFDEKWFIAARELADAMLAHFVDARGGFFDTRDDHETLITRPKDVQDNATPSGNAMAVTVLLKLAALTGDARYRDPAERALAMLQRALVAAPLGFAQWLGALDFALAPVNEIAIIGKRENARALLEVIDRAYRPNQVIALGASASAIPLLHNRAQIGGRATAYVCQNFACQMPVTEADALAAQLN
ncbi:MAG: thioredoxin domain-containing protein [Chloroflexi bacterium]|nr:thioredoxin domain-containing protein [Chloroflexota bacterium]